MVWTIPPLLFWYESKHNNRPQTIGGSGQQRCHNPVTAATACKATYSPIECAHIIQDWVRFVHS